MQYPDIAPNMWKMCHWDGQNNRGFCILYQYISMLAWWWDFIRSTSYKLQLLIQYFWRFYLLYRAYYGAFFYMKSIKHFKYYYLWLLYFATFYRQGIWCLALFFLVIRIHSSNSHYVIVPTTKPTKCGFRSMINVLLSALPIRENQTFCSCPSVHSSCNRVSSVDLRWQKTTCSDGVYLSASLTAAACARQSQPTRHINICSPDIVVVLQYSVQIAPQFSYRRADLWVSRDIRRVQVSWKTWLCAQENK